MQLAFTGTRVSRKDIENQLCPIDDSSLNDLFDVALLRRTEIVIEEKDVGIDRCSSTGDLFQFPAPTNVAGSGRSRRWRISPTTFAPALSARVRNSASDSSASNSGILGRASGFVGEEEARDASRAAPACAVTAPFAPDRPRVRASRPTRKARSCSGSSVATVPRETRVAARAVSRDFLRRELPKPRTPILQCPKRSPPRPP